MDVDSNMKVEEFQAKVAEAMGWEVRKTPLHVYTHILKISLILHEDEAVRLYVCLVHSLSHMRAQFSSAQVRVCQPPN